MTDFMTLGGEPRPPTWSERERLALLRENGVENVYLEPESAPESFWSAVVLLTTEHLASSDSGVWSEWTKEMTYNGRQLLKEAGFAAYRQIVQFGSGEPSRWLGGNSDPMPRVTVGERLASIEHLLDTFSSNAATVDFRRGFDDRARYYRVGLRLEGHRFVPVTSEHLHKEVIEPTLVLLSDDRFLEVDALYRKAFDRILSGDPAGAITVATSAVEEMLRVLLPSMKGQSLGQLAGKARANGIMAPAVEEFTKKLYGLRPDSDAHAGGTSEFELGMFAIHLTGSILLYLGRAKGSA